jgi:hypothetical protein
MQTTPIVHVVMRSSRRDGSSKNPPGAAGKGWIWPQLRRSLVRVGIALRCCPINSLQPTCAIGRRMMAVIGPLQLAPESTGVAIACTIKLASAQRMLARFL